MVFESLVTQLMAGGFAEVAPIVAHALPAMDGARLFPFAEYWWFYGGFLLFVLGVLALDLGVFHRQAHVVKIKEAATWSVVWITLALTFNVLLWQYASGQFGSEVGRQVGLEFLTGYLIEKALSVDNVFIFALVFSFFAIPAQLQHRVLFYGILGALIFRALFIAAGSVLMEYQWIVWLAGGFLIITGIKMAFAGETKLEPERNPVMRLLKRLMPVTPTLEGQAFFVRKTGILHATPLFIALVFVELSDIIFAIDSVPAIFAITKEPLIVFTSNVFAILGLRALYFLLAGIMDRFWALKFGLAAILVFVGVKMLGEVIPGFHNLLDEKGKFPVAWSLSIIGGVLALSAAVSLRFPRQPSA